MNRCTIGNEEEKATLDNLREKLASRGKQIKSIEKMLPKANGLYLRIVMGGINASFIDPEQKFKYKEQYERFKLIVTSIILVISLLASVIHYRQVKA